MEGIENTVASRIYLFVLTLVREEWITGSKTVDFRRNFRARRFRIARRRAVDIENGVNVSLRA